MNAPARTITLPAGLPYDPFRTALYTRDELMGGWPEASLDGRIERHVLEHGFRSPPADEALAQRLHDHAIDVALAQMLAQQQCRVVGIMGSATTRRDDPWFRRVAELARALARAGFTVASGGGPGAMEAANLGAFLAPHADAALEDALSTLARAPGYKSGDLRAYVDAAAEVRERHGPGGPSLAIPTWFYPGEPVGQFASAIAKYFANSIREDGLLMIAVSGVVFGPGRAGTLQELFQDAAQNAYGIRGRSPMVLFGSESYDGDPSIYRLLLEQARRFGGYQDLVTLTDDPAAALAFLEAHQPESAVGALRAGEPPAILDLVRNQRNRAR
jgi:predicted Rossmann-fold nucleotide-binding protein